MKKRTKDSRFVDIREAREPEFELNRQLSFYSKLALMAGILLCQSNSQAIAQNATDDRVSKPDLHEIIVSHADKNNKLQLYRIRDDGSSKRQITDGKDDCLMPAWSPDGKRVVYVQESEKGMDLWLCDPDGNNVTVLTKSGRNIIPSWLPDSRHVIWTTFTPGKDPAEDSQLHIMNTETLESRRLFSDPEQIRFSNSMPVVSPDGKVIAFVSDRTGPFRIWVSNLDGSEARPISPRPVNITRNSSCPSNKRSHLGRPMGSGLPIGKALK